MNLTNVISFVAVAFSNSVSAFDVELASGSTSFLALAFSTRRLTSYQPQYFPRLHYFARIFNADIFTISDYLQYVRKHGFLQKDGSTKRGPSYQAHTVIKTENGPFLLDIPVKKGGIEGRQPLNKASIEYAIGWQQKHLSHIRQNYAHAPYFNELFPSLSETIQRHYSSLAECSIASIAWALSRILEVPASSIAEINTALPKEPFRLTAIVRMSETNIPPADKVERDANDWLIETGRAFKATEYYFGGTAAKAYMDVDRFKAAGIMPVEQDWKCAPYPQLHGQFMPNLSIIDLLMQVPPEEARQILFTKN
jgi:hypothetical protein